MYCGEEAIVVYLGDDIELLLCKEHNDILEFDGYDALKKCKKIPQLSIDQFIGGIK
jgi:hypothetical protein